VDTAVNNWCISVKNRNCKNQDGVVDDYDEIFIGHHDIGM